MRKKSREANPPKLHQLRRDWLPVCRSGTPSKAGGKPDISTTYALAQNSAETLAVLEAHRLSWQALAAIRSNCYEHRLAQRSPKLLDAFFSLIFAPGVSLREATEQCPPWPPGTPLAGKQPTQRLVSLSTMYWNSERALDLVAVMNDLVAKFRKKLDSMPFAQTKEVTDLLCNLLSQELLASKMEQGVTVSTQTRALDSLLLKQKLDLHVQTQERAAKDEQARALEMCLEESKKYPQVVKLFKQSFAALKQARLQS